MTGRLLPFCFLTFSILPNPSFGQSKSSTESVDYSNAVVSVHTLSIPGRARNDFNKGARHLTQRDWAASVPDFQHAIKSFPDFFEAYDLLGVAQLAMQNWTDAETAFRQSIELSHGTYGPPHFGLGLVLCIDHKQYADAAAVVREGLDIDPSDAAGHFALAWVLYTMSRFNDAERSAREAVRCKPSFAEPYLLLAQIHLRLNLFAAAIEDLDGYLKLDSTSPRSARMRSVRAAAQEALAKESATVSADATTNR